MSKYLIQRLFLVIPTLFLAGSLIFSATRILPGDAAALMLDRKSTRLNSSHT